MICEMNETSSRYGTPIEVTKFMGPGSCAQPVPEVETPLRLDISYDHDIFNAIACYRQTPELWLRYSRSGLSARYTGRYVPQAVIPHIPYLLTYPSWIKPGVS